MPRLGSKYQVEHFRNEAVRRLKQCFPDQLEDYATYDCDSNNTNASGTGPPLPLNSDRRFFAKSSTSLGPIHCVPMIPIARAYGLHDMLPVIL